MKRDSAATIFRTVVIAGAMLGTPACGGKKAATQTPASAAPSMPADPATAGSDAPADPAAATPDQPADTGTDANEEDPCAGGQEDPCAGVDRPRGTDDDGGGGMGRGFILS
jgi:hypothetical protein